MGIGEILKKYLPSSLVDSLVKVRVGGTDQKANTILNINIENFQYVVHNPQFVNIGNKLLREGIGYARSDLAPVESRLASVRKPHREIISELKGYMHPMDHGALLGAAAVIKFEDERFDTTSQHKQFESTYQARGRKIYNMLRSNMYRGSNIFSVIICPFLTLLKSLYRDDDKVRGVFCKFFEDMLNFFPYGIWVNEWTMKHRVLEQIRTRFGKYDHMTIYARNRANITTAMKAIDDFKKEKPQEFEIEIKDYVIGTDPAKMITILKKLKE